MAHVLRFLGERALAAATSPDDFRADATPAPDAVFARALGAFTARAILEKDRDWPAGERTRLLTGLSAVVAKGPDVESFVRAYGLR